MTAQGATMTMAADVRGGDGARRDEALAELARALTREAGVVRDLREALLRQRAGVAADAVADVHVSCDDIARVLVTLDSARRHRATVLGSLVRETPATLEALARELGGSLPPELAEAALALRREAEATAGEAAVNRTVLQRTVEAGEAFLQALFTSTTPPDPVYRHGDRREDEAAGFLLDRKV